MHKKEIATSLLSSFAIALGVIVVLDLAFQLPWWFRENGFSISGTCVNYFGEPYSCTLLDWLLRGIISPFVLISVIIPLFIACWLGNFLYLRTKPLRFATTSTIAGCFILVPVLGPVLSIVALVFGALSLRKIAHNETLAPDKGFALAGTILGVLGTVPAISFLLIMLVSIVARGR